VCLFVVYCFEVQIAEMIYGSVASSSDSVGSVEAKRFRTAVLDSCQFSANGGPERPKVSTYTGQQNAVTDCVTGTNTVTHAKLIP
jgi:hypothetical protein